MKSCTAIKKYLCQKYSIDDSAIEVYKYTYCIRIIYAGKYKLYTYEIPVYNVYSIKTHQLDNLDKFFSEYRPENV